jgi:hypothetical protein
MPYTYTDHAEVTGGLTAVIALALVAIRRKDYKVAKALLDQELESVLSSPLLNDGDPNYIEMCRRTREAARQ